MPFLSSTKGWVQKFRKGDQKTLISGMVAEKIHDLYPPKVFSLFSSKLFPELLMEGGGGGGGEGGLLSDPSLNPPLQLTRVPEYKRI